MLRNPYGKVPRQTSFTQQLNLIKHPPVTEQLTKSTQHFKLILSILNLLIDKYPRMTDQILVIKKCIVKWQEHSQQETINKNRQILNMRDSIIVYVKQEVGIVFQQIGEYLKSLTEYYRDDDIRHYYVRYLMALKKIQWKRTITIDQDIQTQSNEFQMIKSLPTDRSINDKTDCSFEGAFIPKKYKQIDLHKYILLKEQNLQLQRKIDKLGTRINELELLNKNLTQQIDKLTEANYAYRSNKEDYLDQIQKLTNILNQMKEDENQRLNRVQELSLNLTESEALFKQSRLNKKQYQQTINNAEESLERKEELLQIQQIQQQFNNNYITARNQHEFQTVKKQNKKEQEDQSNINFQLRFMVMQAIAIESFLTEKVEEVQLLQEGSIELDFSQSH